ncbi:prolipoprotein diacylglyceryl transferase family protein [Nitrospira sp. M1]
MENIVFLLGISLILGMVFRWAFHALPQEQWQMLAIVPIHKTQTTVWKGLNLTYYGALTAFGVSLAVSVTCILLGTIGVALSSTIHLAILLLGITVPTAKFIAKAVEKKPHTFTIGGSSFVGILMAPWAICFLNWLQINGDAEIPLLPAWATLWISLAFGEGVGRLACLSYGCCYGKPLSQAGPFAHKLFSHVHLQFTGPNKKASYESNLESVPLIPIQAMTALVNTFTGIIGMHMFLNAEFTMAIAWTAIVTQGWRIVSEFMRADYRGQGTWSSYQIMALAGIAYTIGLLPLWPHEPISTIDIMNGLHILWTPEFFFLYQILWVLIFFFTGRSQVTGSSIEFYVHPDRQ